MSVPPKKSFSAFLRSTLPEPPVEHVKPVAEAAIVPLQKPAEPPPERTRHVTSTGRIRTHTASRNLPGVTLRLSEERWERLKMLSIQERRPIQDILGQALDSYMKRKGLPW